MSGAQKMFASLAIRVAVQWNAEDADDAWKDQTARLVPCLEMVYRLLTTSWFGIAIHLAHD